MRLGFCIGFAFMLAFMGSCAETKLAATQCGLSGELKAAAQTLTGVEATALVCIAGGQTVDGCEEAAGATVAAKAITNAPQEAKDVLVCAAALIHDVAAEKAGAHTTAGK